MKTFIALCMGAAFSSALDLEALSQLQAEAELDLEQANQQGVTKCEWPAGIQQLNTPEYFALSASCKHRLLWQKVVADTRLQRWFDGPDLQPLFDQDMNLSFDHTGDSMPDGRNKMTHPRGVTMKVAFRATPDSPYTGIFRGAQYGILRVSETVRTFPEKPQTSPGFGIKFLRDGMDSADTVTMFSFDGQPSFNYFAHRWSTILNEPLNECARETIGKKLAETTNHIGAMSVKSWSEYDEAGLPVKYPVYPFQLEFEPYDVYGWTDTWQADFSDQFMAIEPGTVMWKVFAYDCPVHKLSGSRGDLIGHIVLTSRITTSLWGDEKLFFKHQRMEDALEQNAWWADYLQTWSMGRLDETGITPTPPAEKCPFAFLFDTISTILDD